LAVRREQLVMRTRHIVPIFPFTVAPAQAGAQSFPLA
jgi:hypothetical protein